MDFRIAEGMYGDLLGRKIPAGYFHLIPDTEEEEERLAQRPPREVSFNNGKTNIFYVANNTSSTYPIPVHLQRYMLMDYSKKNGLTADLELFDLEDMLHCRRCGTSSSTATSTSSCTASSRCRKTRPSAIACSRRRSRRGMIMHFVNEDLALTSADDLKTIKNYLEFSKYGKSRLPIGLPLSDLSREYFGKWSASLAEWRQ